MKTKSATMYVQTAMPEIYKSWAYAVYDFQNLLYINYLIRRFSV